MPFAHRLSGIIRLLNGCGKFFVEKHPARTADIFLMSRQERKTLPEIVFTALKKFSRQPPFSPSLLQGITRCNDEKSRSRQIAGMIAGMAACLSPLTTAAKDDAKPAAAQTHQRRSIAGRERCREETRRATVPRTFRRSPSTSPMNWGKWKEQENTVPTDKLAEQANTEKTFFVQAEADAGKTLDAEAIYAQSKPGVVVVGGISNAPSARTGIRKVPADSWSAATGSS